MWVKYVFGNGDYNDDDKCLVLINNNTFDMQSQ